MNVECERSGYEEPGFSVKYEQYEDNPGLCSPGVYSHFGKV